MEIRHSVIYSPQDSSDLETLQGILDQMGISFGHGRTWTNIIISESDPRWADVEELMLRYQGRSLGFDTIFTDEEVLAAQWCLLLPDYMHGYPEPSKWSVDRSYTYEDHCRCGVHGRQHAPFRIKKKPRLGRHQFFCLFWATEYFAVPDVFSTLADAGITGYEEWPLLRSGQAVETTVAQIYIPAVTSAVYRPAEPGRRERCPQCGTVKHNVHRLGPMQVSAELLAEEADLVHSHDWFGSGFEGHREIFATQRVARLILESGWKGLYITPVQIVE